MISKLFETLIDYAMTITASVEACACPRTNNDIRDDTVEDLFQTPSGQQRVSLEMICFEEGLTTEDALQRINGLGKRPCTVKETLLFAAANQKIQWDLPIISLGSTVQSGDERCALFLYKDKLSLTQDEMEHYSVVALPKIGRSAQLGLYENKWGTIVYFLVTNKE